MTRISWILALLAALGCKDDGPSGDDTGGLGTDLDGDGYAAGVDCDDEDAAVNPGAAEVCDGVDNNCDGVADGADAAGAQTFYPDADADGYGDDGGAFLACEGGAGAVDRGGDCDDGDAAFNPGAAEDDCADPNDYNCDGSVGYADADGDGWAACEDCDDGDAGVNAGAAEVCDGVDNDCDGVIDGEDATDARTFYVDGDGDGYGDGDFSLRDCAAPEGYVDNDEDCDDADAGRNPDTVWYLDTDRDGYGDEDFTFVQCAQPTGYGLSAGDCDDTRAAVNPGAAEVCNGLDDDCDGAADDADADVTGRTTWYADGDGDGYGDAASGTLACDAPTGHLSDATDCDDGDAAVYPGAPEACDAVDADCDGDLNDPDSADALTFYTDSDGDGFGDPSASVSACTPPSGTSSDATDCDDGDSSVYPGSHATETPRDGVDTDCDGDDDCSDLNCDGWPDLVFTSYYDGTGYNVDSTVYFGSATGFSASSSATLPTAGARNAHARDFNDDGYLDLLVVSYYDGNYVTDSSIFYGSATGFSASNRDDLNATGPVDACVEDLDGDGLLDVVLAGYYNGSNYATSSLIFWNSASGFSNSNTTTLSSQRGARDCKIEDLDGDGYPDIVFASYLYSTSTDSTTSYIYWGSSAGYSDSDVTGLSGYRAPHVHLADIDADGWTDILLPFYYDGNYSTNSYIYWGSSAGYSSSDRSSLSGVGVWDAAIDDFDGDGRLDVVLGSYASASGTYTGNYTNVYYQSQNGFSTSNRDTVAALGTRQLSSVDLDADGYPELVLSNLRRTNSDWEESSYVYWGSSTGYANSARTDLPTKGNYGHAIGDVDLDGYLDLVYGNYINNSSSYSLDSSVYHGSASGYSSLDVTNLPTTGVWGDPLIVGAD